MRKTLALIGLVIVAFPLQAQEPAPGAVPATAGLHRIRLHEPWSLRLAPTVRTTLADSKADSLPLTTAAGSILLVPQRDVISVDSLTSVTPRNVMVKRGLKNGVLAGAVAGVVFGALGHQDDGSGLSSSRGGSIAIGAVGGAVLGAIIGGISGATKSGEQWKQLWSNEQTASAPSR
jgi:hypothetical protein